MSWPELACLAFVYLLQARRAGRRDGPRGEMMDTKTRKKWDAASRGYDFVGAFGEERRWRPHKALGCSRRWKGRSCSLAVGTGLDIAAFPPGKQIYTASTSAPKCWRRPRRGGGLSGGDDAAADGCPRHGVCRWQLRPGFYVVHLLLGVRSGARADGAASRVLKPGGYLGMFDVTTGSRHFPFGVIVECDEPGPPQTRSPRWQPGYGGQCPGQRVSSCAR